MNKTEYADYLGDLKAWDAERQRQSVEFTITEKDPDADVRLPDLEVRVFDRDLICE